MRSAARWIAAHELWLLAIAAPALLFPFAWPPYAAAALILVCWLSRWLTFGRPTVRTPLDMPILVLLVMTLIGWAISIDRVLSATRAWGVLLGLAVYYALVNTLRAPERFWPLIKLLLLLSIAVSLLAFAGTDWGAVRLLDLPWLYDHLPTLVRGLPGSGVPHDSDLFNPRLIGATMGLLLPFLLAMSALQVTTRWRLLSLFAVVLVGAILLLSQSPQAVTGVLVALLFMAACRDRRALLAFPVGTLIAGALVWWLGAAKLGVYLLSTDNPVGIAIVLRIDIWRQSLAMIHDMPFSGTGLNTFPVMMTYFYPGFFLGPVVHAHNLYLQTALDFGLPGLAAFAWLLLASVARAVQHYRLADRTRRLLILGLSASVLSFLVHGLFDTIPLGGKPAPMLWAMLALLVVLPVGAQSASEGNERDRGFLALTVFAGVWLALSVLVPGAFQMNLAAAQAHLALAQTYQSNTRQVAALGTAVSALKAVLPRQQANPRAYDLLGRADAWLDDEDGALAALSEKARLDLLDPLGRYFPSEGMKRQLQGTSPGNPEIVLVSIYSQWITRYPQRAENYITAALVLEREAGGDAAAQVARLALAQGAQPRSLVLRYLERRHLAPQ